MKSNMIKIVLLCVGIACIFLLALSVSSQFYTKTDKISNDLVVEKVYYPVKITYITEHSDIIVYVACIDGYKFIVTHKYATQIWGEWADSVPKPLKCNEEG